MKKTKFFMPLIAALALSSCSSDEPLAPENGFDETFDGQAYMKVRIAMSDGAASRAGEFVNGTAEEQKIKEIGLKFYNADGSFYGYGIPVENPTVNATNPDGTSIEGKISEAVIVLQINNNAPKPTHVVAYANCGDGWKITPEPAISSVILKSENNDVVVGNSLIKESITTDYGSEKFYAMTSSNYRRGGAGAVGFLQGYQTRVKPESFLSTEDAAKTSGNPVDIYVERLAAKVKVGLGTGVEPTTIENGDYTLDFVVDGYALGATNSSSYYIKNIHDQWSATTLWNTWNDETNHRCYWAYDINYYTAINSTPNPPLGYVSYNGVSRTLAASKDKWLYTAENTCSSFFGESNGKESETTAVNKAPRATDVELNRYLYQTFAYVIGHYVVKRNGTAIEPTDGKDTYLYECAGHILDHDNMLVYLQNTLGDVLFTRSQLGDASAVYTGVNLVAEKFVEIGSYNGDASLVCLQTTKALESAITASKEASDVNAKLYIKKPNAEVSGEGKSDSDYVEIDNVDELKALLKQSAVQAYGFKYDETAGGYLAYFPILIKHLNTTGDSVKYGEDSRGYYGVVRNHCYNITINSITGLGIGIFDPTVDIIPKDKIKPLYLAATFNVLSWRTVDQTVDL